MKDSDPSQNHILWKGKVIPITGIGVCRGIKKGSNDHTDENPKQQEITLRHFYFFFLLEICNHKLPLLRASCFPMILLIVPSIESMSGVPIEKWSLVTWFICHLKYFHYY